MSGTSGQGNNFQNPWAGQHRGPRPTQGGGGIIQYFGERTINSNFVFQTPGTYNVGVHYSNGAQGNGAQDPQPALAAPPAPRNEWAPSSQSVERTGFAPSSHAMGSQTTPGLMNVDSAPSSTTEKGSDSPKFRYYQ